ncbi:uncharacterized protein [Aristolochia californica]|uniref:uncharacterized protein n=1 Tax=Aristolochia californica TaxID=171875 RepID=UPI0035D9D1DD
MYATICRQHKNSDQGIAEMLTAGFSGILKGWWDNILTNEQHHEIYNAKKVIKTEAVPAYLGEDDAVYTLISCIVHHFIGRLTSQTDKGREVLQNLRCRTLSHFKWYKDVFLTKVMQRPDANNEYWKAKYIDGLPTLFANKVRKRIGNEVGSINYHQYTYGPQPSHQMKGKGKASHSKRPEPYSHQNRRYTKRQSHQKTRLEPRRPPRQRYPPRRNPPDKKKILAKILLNSDSGDDIDYASSSQSEEEPDCSCSHLQSVAQMHQINVLTSMQQRMLENIDQEENPHTKRFN